MHIGPIFLIKCGDVASIVLQIASSDFVLAFGATKRKKKQELRGNKRQKLRGKKRKEKAKNKKQQVAIGSYKT